MDREYEIFECLEDGAVMWCAHASGLPSARLKLDELSRETVKEYFAMHLSTRDIIFAGDSPVMISNPLGQRIFQIAYDDRLSRMRAPFLRSLGCSVISVVGNEAAKSLLSMFRKDDLRVTLFVVGHPAPVQTREDMVAWLRANYPEASILALNPPNQQLPDADYNVEEHSPGALIPIVTSVISSLQAD